MRVDTDGLRDAAKRLREEAVVRVDWARLRTDQSPDESLDQAFGDYGGAAAYLAASRAWAAELASLKEVLGEVAQALVAAADGYDRADAAAAGRLGTVR